ncbi:MAG: DUF3644 domain-containing protein [Bacteroidales bacterium]|nr:DUF3644 domain-containing protein [Bacteroidales bacterium]
MAKRKSPIAKSFINNSIGAIFSAIEIHNKPSIKYRYEIVVLLVINAWELLLKGYLYKFHRDVKLFQKDGTSKPFENCVNIANQKIGKTFNPTKENLLLLYLYRNQVAHSYVKELDSIIYAVIKKTIIFYSDFLKEHFKIDLSDTSDLILLPIGFKKMISPVDYISNKSAIENAPEELKKFIKSIIESTKRLNDDNLSESIFVDFKINLTNVKEIKNADIIAGIDNSKTQEVLIRVEKPSKKIISSSEGQKVVLTRRKEEIQGILYYEQLDDGIFDEINNLVEANQILAKDNSRFMLGLPIYYRIYAERQFVNYNVNNFKTFAFTGMLDFYAPFLYWLIKLPDKTIAELLFAVYQQCKSPKINNLNKIVFLLGNKAIRILNELYEEDYKMQVQKPQHYYSFKTLIKSKRSNPILKCIGVSQTARIFIQNDKKEYTYQTFLDDTNFALNKLSSVCKDVFEGYTMNRSVARDLDYIVYSSELASRHENISAEIEKVFK